MKLFELRNLQCTYNNIKTVLRVDELIIEKGKLVVIVGLSGSGKSTLLETLGLMNNTIGEGSKLLFYPNGDDTESHNLSELWKDKTENQLAELRKEHFSFIFQSTNLMPNFSIYENICLTQMLQGKSMGKSKGKVMKMMELVGLNEERLLKHSEGEEENRTFKSTAEISGGERQRVAFLRAFASDFTVLFGDEPTGSLDENTSNQLMQLIKKEIVELKRSAIIVSHNIDLAVDFADKIIILTKPGEEQVGTIEEHNVYDKNGNWSNSNGEFYSDLEFKDFLKASLDNIKVFTPEHNFSA